MSQQVFHFLYIDSNDVSRKEVSERFRKADKIQKFNPHYQIKITPYADFRAAMRTLLVSNISSVQEEYIREYKINIVPIDSIIFEVSANTSKKYGWQSFMRDVQHIGFSRLNLNHGLIAFGLSSTFTPSTIETLMRYRVSHKILSPFTHEQFGDVVTDYLNGVRGSTYFALERNVSKSSEQNKEMIRRLVRFYGERGEERGITLDVLEYDPQTFITRAIDDPLDIVEGFSPVNEEDSQPTAH